MKSSIITVLLIFAAITASSSEMTATSKEKVDESQVIATASVTSIDPGQIREFDHTWGRRQQVDIDLKVTSAILGSPPEDISIRAYSTSYEDEDGAHGATAGFSAFGMKPGEEYLIYVNPLPKKDWSGKARYELASDSNQFFEKILREDNLIAANGQNGNFVPLDSKLETITELAREKNSAQQGAAANP